MIPSNPEATAIGLVLGGLAYVVVMLLMAVILAVVFSLAIVVLILRSLAAVLRGSPLPPWREYLADFVADVRRGR